METTDSRFRQAQFHISTPNLAQLPVDTGYEIAFAGRSNAGKSSALNILCDNRRLARTSKTPGRTQQIIFFTLDAERRFVDLPGYGYAKVPIKLRKSWQNLMQGYFNGRHSIKGLVLVVDIRRSLEADDQQMLAWCEFSNTPVHLLLTKADKLSRSEGLSRAHQVTQSLKHLKTEYSLQIFSAPKRLGISQLSDTIRQWLALSD